MKINSKIEVLMRKLLSGEISKKELNELNTWYDTPNKQEEIKVLTGTGESKEEIKQRMVDRLKNEIRYEKNNQSISATRFRRIGRMIAAVAAVVVLGVTFFINTQNKRFNEMNKILSQTELLERSNPNGQKSKIVLTDGTTLWLNAASKIRFPKNFSSNNREVFLEGEAFFDVTRDENRPFKVHLKNTITTVLGTSFNIKSYAEESVQVTVATGRVQVNTGVDNPEKQDELILLPNEQITFLPESGELTKKNVDVEYYASWKDDIIRFDNTKLSEVVKTLERWYDKKIVLENEKLGSCVLVAEYKHEKLYNVLQSLKFSLGVDFEILEDEIVIFGKGCN